MWIYVCGDNDRSYYLREEALHRGHCVTCPDDADWVVLPLPQSAVSEQLKAHLHRGVHLLCGLVDENLEREAKANGWKLHYIYRDEKYQWQNSMDSAEGAVYALMREAPFTLRGKTALIIGYGKLGTALKMHLEGAGVQAIVAARNPVQRESAGEDSLDIAKALEQMGDFDLIVNTVPAQIIGRSALEKIKPGAVLMDTASSPYGFHLEEALALRIKAFRENGIPGRYCPKTAALRLLDCMERGWGT